MYEQDVKLATMLIAKIRAIRGEENSVKEALNEARAELERVQQIREERDAYLAILSEAADLLDSKDLVVENPDTTEQQELVDGLEYKIEELDEESQKYNRLIEALREKAPQLFESSDSSDPEAASDLSEETQDDQNEEASASLETETDEEAAPVLNDIEDSKEAEQELEEEETEAETVQIEETAAEVAAEVVAEARTATDAENSAGEAAEAEAAEDEPEESADAATQPPTLEIHVGSNGHAGAESVSSGNGSPEKESANTATAIQSAPVASSAGEVQVSTVKVAVESPERTLSRFNLDHLKKKEAFTFGRGAAYIVDGDSVLDRLPYYDFSLRGVLENQTRDELARDIDVLSTELHGSFHIVYGSQYNSSINLGDDVSLNCADGEGGKEAADDHVRLLVSELIAKHTCVCVITGDVALADSVRGQSIHILQLHDFFRA